MLHFFIFLMNIFFAQNNTITHSWTDVPNYGQLARLEFDLIPRSTVTHMINFTLLSPLDFIHVEFMVTCESGDNTFDWRNEVRMSRNRGRMMEPYTKRVYETKDFAIGSTTTEWVTSFYPSDCIDIDMCVFGISITTFHDCEGTLNVERGDAVPFGRNHKFLIPVNHTSHHTKRLIQYYPPSAPQQVKVTGPGRWFIFYGWGYSSEVHMGSSIGDFVVTLHEDDNYNPGDRLMMWFDAAPGEYEFDFLHETSEDKPALSMAARIIVVTLAFIFTFITVFTSLYIYRVFLGYVSWH